mmetsp:Transcript_37189/g.87492  ORF Transcript_37189/g.87492 Transcript_37189/m.87492 type:complete len:223 (-) Transcript_37189:619-1287(-)
MVYLLAHELRHSRQHVHFSAAEKRELLAMLHQQLRIARHETHLLRVPLEVGSVRARHARLLLARPPLELPQKPFHLDVVHQPLAQPLRHRSERHVVVRRADPSDRDHRRAVRRHLFDSLGDLLGLVWEDGDAAEDHPTRAQHPRRVVRVHILDLGAQDLIPNGDYRSGAQLGGVAVISPRLPPSVSFEQRVHGLQLEQVCWEKRAIGLEEQGVLLRVVLAPD